MPCCRGYIKCSGRQEGSVSVAGGARVCVPGRANKAARLERKPAVLYRGWLPGRWVCSVRVAKKTASSDRIAGSPVWQHHEQQLASLAAPLPYAGISSRCVLRQGHIQAARTLCAIARLLAPALIASTSSWGCWPLARLWDQVAQACVYLSGRGVTQCSRH